MATSTSLTTTISSSDWAFNVSITLMPTYYAEGGREGGKVEVRRWEWEGEGKDAGKEEHEAVS